MYSNLASINETLMIPRIPSYYSGPESTVLFTKNCTIHGGNISTVTDRPLTFVCTGAVCSCAAKK